MFKLHLVTLPTPAVAATAQLDALFAQYEHEARDVAETGVLTTADLWSLAQYLDLAEAGHAKPGEALVHKVRACIRSFLNRNTCRTEVRALCGRSSSLSTFVRESLDRAAGMCAAQPQALAA